MNFFQPGKPVGVGQRNAVVHFVDVRWWVKIVGVKKCPAQSGGEYFAHRGFSCSGCAHQNDDHGNQQSDGSLRSGAV